MQALLLQADAHDTCGLNREAPQVRTLLLQRRALLLRHGNFRYNPAERERDRNRFVS